MIHTSSRSQAGLHIQASSQVLHEALQDYAAAWDDLLEPELLAYRVGSLRSHIRCIESTGTSLDSPWFPGGND